MTCSCDAGEIKDFAEDETPLTTPKQKRERLRDLLNTRWGQDEVKCAWRSEASESTLPGWFACLAGPG